MTDGLANTPDPPYYAVIFTNRRCGADDGVGITVSYWRDEASLKAWKQVAEHAAARRLGCQRWYDAYELRVARVERAYNFERD